MPKQIIDIIQTPSLDITLPKRKASGDNKLPKKDFKKTSRGSSRGRLFVRVIAVIGFIAAVCFALTFWSHLEVSLVIEQRDAEFSGEIIAINGQDSLNEQDKVIPVNIAQLTKETNETFSSTGKMLLETKAEGFIWVYNAKNPPATSVFKAQTRFLSSDNNKIFKAPDKILLPAGQLKNGKIVPSKTKIKVIAQESGEDYNIGPSKFSVPGLSGSSAYYVIWAESDEGMAGGLKKEIGKVQYSDIEGAKTALQAKLKEQILNDWHKQSADGIVIFPEAILDETFEINYSKKPEEPADSFDCQAKLTMKSLSFKYADMRSLTLLLLESQVLSGEKLRAETLNLNFNFKNIDKTASKLVLVLAANAKIAKSVDETSLVKRVSGKKEGDIKDIIKKEFSQVKDFKLKFWPFWVKAAPKELEKIKINVEYSQ